MGGTLAFVFSLVLPAFVSQTADPCRLGNQAFTRGEAALAERLLLQCLDQDPPDLSAYLRLCAFYQSQGRDDDLYEVALRGLESFPQEPRFYLTVGIRAGRKENYDQAILTFSEGLRRWPGDARFRSNLVQAYSGRGMAHLDRGDDRAAESDLRKALELDPNDPEVLINLGRALHNLKNYVEALSNFDRALEIAPQTPLSHFHRGLALYALGQYEAAAEAFSNEIGGNPEYPPSYYFRGRARMYRAEWEGAAADLAEASQKMPEHAAAVYALGRCWVHLEQQEKAEAAFRKSLELDPQDTGTLNSLGRLLVQKGRTGEAQELFRRAAAEHARVRSVQPGEIRFESFRSPRPN